MITLGNRLQRCGDSNQPIGARDCVCLRHATRQLRWFAALMMVTCCVGSAQAYPDRPVRLMVTFPGGGGIDFTARIVGQKLAEAWGQQFVIDNRAGGGGVIGTEIVARAAPDGHTLLLASGTGFIINPLLMAKLPYDPFKDFTPVTLIAINPTILCVHPSLPVNTVKELIAHARAKPRQLNYASAGNGSPIHLGMELFKSMTATDMVHVPYKGSVPAVTDLLAGQVQVMLNSMPTMLPHVKTGKLRALAVGGAQRAKAVPELVTVAEAGVPGFEVVAWVGLAAPAKTPAPVIGKLNKEVARVLADADVVQRLATHGAEAQSSTPEGFAQFMRDESARARKVIAIAGIKAE
jgi:tripartite-type tricarboxylate transporter receptor subunit TctC